MANWNLEVSAGAPGASFLWRGAWSSALSYNPNNGILASDGSGYVSLTNNQNKDPISNPSDWNMFASVGAQGPQGIQGPVGSPMPVGSVADFAGIVEPVGWIFCFGQSLLRAGTYAGLFATLGTTYGFVDATHFNVPDLRGYVSVGKQDMGGADVSEISRQLVTTRTGNTIIGQTIITNVGGGLDSDICGGMQASGPGVPAGTIVDYIHATGVALDKAFTTTQNGGTFTFGSVDGKTLGARGGNAYDLLRQGQIALHTHTVFAGSNAAGSNMASGSGWAITTISTSAPLGIANNPYHGQKHSSIQPSFVLNKIIKY